jgi:hypothetical protein
MLAKFLRMATRTVDELCERCGSVCDDRCRRAAILGRGRDRAIESRVGLL